MSKTDLTIEAVAVETQAKRDAFGRARLRVTLREVDLTDFVAALGEDSTAEVLSAIGLEQAREHFGFEDET